MHAVYIRVVAAKLVEYFGNPRRLKLKLYQFEHKIMIFEENIEFRRQICTGNQHHRNRLYFPVHRNGGW